MIDYEVGDIVIGISRGKPIYGRKFEVISMIGSSDISTPHLREIKTGKSESGWWASRFRKYKEGDENTCLFCKSQCRREEPCEFYQSTWEEIS